MMTNDLIGFVGLLAREVAARGLDRADRQMRLGSPPVLTGGTASPRSVSGVSPWG